MKKIIIIRNVIIILYPIIFTFIFYKFSFFKNVLDRFIVMFNDKANAVILFMFLFVFIPEVVVLLITNYFFKD